MPYADRAASRFGRDRDLLPEPPACGPYEAAYDVRRGYQQPLENAPRRPPADGVASLGRAREWLVEGVAPGRGRTDGVA